MSLLLLQNTALALPLCDQSVHCIVTSPPYWGLRDYGTPGQVGLEPLHDCLGWATGQRCEICYLCVMVAVFRECKRVLRNDGTLWVNIADSYARNPQKGDNSGDGKHGAYQCGVIHDRPLPPGIRAKNLCGIPQRLALALQNDGWYWRSEIIWAKPNPMPESVTDRCTKAHEQVLLFAKQERYFYDAEGVKEPPQRTTAVGWKDHDLANYSCDPRLEAQGSYKDWRKYCPTGVVTSRNLRTVWTLATEPTPFAHFATMPTALVERCIKAGTSPHGVCAQCGAPWVRQVTSQRLLDGEPVPLPAWSDPTAPRRMPVEGKGHRRYATQRTESGFIPSCRCTVCPVHDFHSGFCVGACPSAEIPAPVPAVVFDPFVGSGTVPLVARALGRHGVGSDLSWVYLHDIARKRLGLQALDAWEHGATPEGLHLDDLPLFQVRTDDDA